MARQVAEAVLVLTVVLGVLGWELRRVLPALIGAWLFASIISFIVAGVADDGDIGAFVGSAVVLLVLAVLLWRLGVWLAGRRTDLRPR